MKLSNKRSEADSPNLILR